MAPVWLGSASASRIPRRPGRCNLGQRVRESLARADACSARRSSSRLPRGSHRPAISADLSILLRSRPRICAARMYCEEILKCLIELLQAGRAMRSGSQELRKRSRFSSPEHEPSCSSMRGDSRCQVASGGRTAGGTIRLRPEPQDVFLRKRELAPADVQVEHPNDPSRLYPACHTAVGPADDCLGGTARLVLARRAVRGVYTHAEGEPGARAHTALIVSPVECRSLRGRRRPANSRDRRPIPP